MMNIKQHPSGFATLSTFHFVNFLYLGCLDFFFELDDLGMHPHTEFDEVLLVVLSLSLECAGQALDLVLVIQFRHFQDLKIG